MFGMGITEIILIAIVAIIALGPEKLPDTMVSIAKFIKKFKNSVSDAKTALDSELNISEMKEEATKFKSQIEDTKNSLAIDTKVDLGLDNILNDTPLNKEKTSEIFSVNNEKVSFKKPEDNA